MAVDDTKPRPGAGECPFRAQCAAKRATQDFPIEWERDHYVSRREMTKFLTLGSALLFGANAVIAALGQVPVPKLPAVRIGVLGDVPEGGSMLFRYPTDEDPCILIRESDGELKAYSQVCTHLACAVVHRPEKGVLYCPCHQGVFTIEEGRPIAGPPTRPLPRILLEQRGDEIYAVGVEV